jgi:hypothetical protein
MKTKPEDWIVTVPIPRGDGRLAQQIHISQIPTILDKTLYGNMTLFVDTRRLELDKELRTVLRATADGVPFTYENLTLKEKESIQSEVREFGNAAMALKALLTRLPLHDNGVDAAGLLNGLVGNEALASGPPAVVGDDCRAERGCAAVEAAIGSTLRELMNKGDAKPRFQDLERLRTCLREALALVTLKELSAWRGPTKN